MDAAVGYEAEQVDTARRPERVRQDLVLCERSGGDRVVDARQILPHDRARAEVEVADLGVAHLPVR